ncbi:RND transporter [Cytobacillus firmus]|uniref:efflux RND transporter periplasmic adaptor subunit n=1 Tax=Cytobacillus firmus TaxID=1399 RepID=UPI0018CC93FC|nr:RND transporter [Cytobacillus firmus]MDD9310185.1 RND transporter [Cytobacillus firmus]MED1942933.1 RND transporter [Cytobacillus firmus]
MKRAWVLRILVACIGIFIAANLYLALKPGSKVDKTAYIDKWQAVSKENLIDSFSKKGVVSPAEEYQVYYDERQGVFNQFLVKEGDAITPGTGLFEYQPEDLDAEKERLNAEAEKLENQIEDLEGHIEDMETYKRTLIFAEEEKDSETTVTSSLDRDIYEKELQVSLLERELEMTENQLDYLEDQPGSVTVQSNFTGTISEIDRSLENPIITITSDASLINGELTLDERMETSIGLKVLVSAKDFKGEGSIINLASLPKSGVSLNKESIYPFSVQLNEDATEILKGTPVHIEIVTDEIEGAVTVPAEVIKKDKNASSLWVISNTGKLERRNIESGLQVNGRTEIKDGLEKGEWIVMDKGIHKDFDGTEAATSFKTKYLSKKQISSLKNKTKWKYILKGFVSR